MSRSDSAISVVIPVFNGAAFLAEAVASVQAQSLRPDEIIIVDDGSVDGTPELIRTLGEAVRSCRQPNAGPAAARNRGIELARGAFIAFIDADDLWCEGKLESQARRLRGDPALQLVLGATQRVAAAAGGSTAGRAADLVPTGPAWLLLSVGAALFRRSVFDTVGTFDETLRQGEDVDWFMRAREQGIGMGISGELVQRYRRHGGNLTGNHEEKDRAFLVAMKKSLDRRRMHDGHPGELEPIDELANFDPGGEEDDV